MPRTSERKSESASERVACPLCGVLGELVPHPARAGRLVLYCQCRAGRAVLETDETITFPLFGGALVRLPGVNDEIARALCNAGFNTLNDVARASDEELLGIPGIGSVTLERIRMYFSLEQKE